MFKKAQRKAAKLRLALMGPAGSGKTFSALTIANGIGGRIAMIDTERGSGELYSDLCSYDVAQISPPFTPQKYIEAIKTAEKAGYDVLIIDSLSHAWAGEGGVLDIHDKVSKSTRNSFAAWREVTPQHNALVDALLGASCHIIVTLRAKTSYEVQQDGDKKKVVKVGLAPVQREGLEYEFTLVLDLSIEGHVATATKDRTGIFDGKYFTPNQETGSQILNWLNSGKPEEIQVPVQKPQEKIVEHPHQFLHDQLHRMLEQTGLMDHLDLYYLYVNDRYNVFSIDMLTQKQLMEQLTMLRQCKQREEKLNQFIEILQQQKIAA